VPSLHQLQSPLLDRYRFLDNLGFSVEFAQAEIVGGKFGGEYKDHVVVVGCCRLQRCVGGFQRTPYLTEQIRLVIQQERNLEGVLRERPAQGHNFRAISRIPGPRSIGIGAHGGKVSRRCDPCQCARLVKTVFGRGERLVGLEQLLLVVIQIGVVVDLPPRALGNRVLGCGDAPRAFRRVSWRSGHGRAMVVRAYRASRQQATSENGRRQGQSPHDDLPPWLSGATFTCWPSSMESAGLTITRSSISTPPRISSVAP